MKVCEECGDMDGKHDKTCIVAYPPAPPVARSTIAPSGREVSKPGQEPKFDAHAAAKVHAVSAELNIGAVVGKQIEDGWTSKLNEIPSKSLDEKLAAQLREAVQLVNNVLGVCHGIGMSASFEVIKLPSGAYALLVNSITKKL